ncbi:hypothetical protein [Parasitella parasitica]|uniref:DUF4218 domain-containing protein n=1 Tax=Parasitella parasitica TaxID=35722 RepID=A0A0B7NF70_9FUNG|nr:hypothetical protein [Parasitella parasitica]
MAIKGKGLSKDHYDIFMYFHLACRLILKPSMTKKDAADAHSLFFKYNLTFVQLYTAEYVRPYNHLLVHLHRNILDFGSAVHPWCLSYERYNYLLKSVNTSQKGHFEKTIMRKIELLEKGHQE